MAHHVTLKRIACAALVAAVSACGGGGGGSDSASTPATPSLSGTFVDAPVAGLSYTTSGGYSGVTDAQGQFKYNEGETLTFKIGNLTLGSTAGGTTVGPVDLSTDANKVSNMLVLLQSLDSDDAEDTITLSPSVASANLTAIDLSLPPATFGSSSNTALVAAQTAAGVTKPVVSPEAAQAHVETQFQKQAEGVWSLYANGTALPTVFGFDAAGAYVLGEAQGDTVGMERGVVAINPLSAHLTATVAQDTNGEGGFSHPSEAEKTSTTKIDGSDMVFRTAAGEELFRLKRIANDATSIVGAWVFESTANLGKGLHFVFLPDGHYMLIDPIGDTEASACGGPGVEYGTYSYNKTAGTLSFTGISVDTNGCAGASDFVGASIPAVLAADGNTLTLTFEENAVLKRVSK